MNTRNNWQLGFAKGVAACVNNNTRIEIDEFVTKVSDGALDELIVLQNVGRDEPNGIWRMLGARMGVYMTMLTEWDPVNVNNEQALDEIWASIETSDVEIVAGTVAEELVEQLKLPIVKLDTESCKFIKRYIQKNPH